MQSCQKITLLYLIKKIDNARIIESPYDIEKDYFIPAHLKKNTSLKHFVDYLVKINVSNEQFFKYCFKNLKDENALSLEGTISPENWCESMQFILSSALYSFEKSKQSSLRLGATSATHGSDIADSAAGAPPALDSGANAASDVPAVRPNANAASVVPAVRPNASAASAPPALNSGANAARDIPKARPNANDESVIPAARPNADAASASPALDSGANAARVIPTVRSKANVASVDPAAARPNNTLSRKMIARNFFVGLAFLAFNFYEMIKMNEFLERDSVNRFENNANNMYLKSFLVMSGICFCANMLSNKKNSIFFCTLLLQNIALVFAAPIAVEDPRIAVQSFDSKIIAMLPSNLAVIVCAVLTYDCEMEPKELKPSHAIRVVNRHESEGVGSRER